MTEKEVAGLIATHAEKIKKQAKRSVNHVDVLVARNGQSILLADRHRALVALEEIGVKSQKGERKDD